MTKQSTRVVLAKATPSKASDSAASFVGYASVFDVIDSYGDVVRKGAFAKSIESLTAEGAQPLGVYYAHNMNGSPYGLVGVVKSLIEDDYGLRVEADLYVDSNPEAKFLHQAMQDGVINEMSFAYYVTESSWATHEGQEVYEIKSVDLLEVSVCPVGVNRQALIQEVKARLTPRGKSAPEDIGELTPVIVEDEGTEELEGAKADDEEDAPDLATVRALLTDAIAAVDAFESASKAITDPDPADDPADKDSKAAAEEHKTPTELRARKALALAHSRARKENE